MNATFSSKGTTENIKEMSNGVARAGKDLYQETAASAQRVGEKLRNELTNFRDELDALLSRASSISDEELSAENARLMAKYSSVKYAAKGLAEQANRQISHSVDMASEYVKDRPLQSLLGAIGAGLFIGMLFGRR